VVLSLLALGLVPDRARDVAQSAWLRLYDKDLAGQLPTVSLPGLAIAQARFLALDELRRDTRERRRHAVPELLEQVTEPTSGPEARLLAREELDRALAELDACPAQKRRVFLMLYEEPGLTHRECAARVGLSVQRVRQIVCEVRARLRGAIAREGDTP
jgi:RNA polymerase sigma-70 factor (ECF subfamily)